LADAEMKIPLSAQFFAWIFLGLFIFIGAFSFTWKYVCLAPSADPAEQGRQQNDEAHSLRHLINEDIWRSITLANGNQIETAKQAKKPPGAEPNPRISSLICDAKITDWALAFFTYALVIVGWFGIKSGRQSTEATERAYVYARLAQRSEDLPGTMQGIATRIRVAYVEVVLDNHGRTAGYVDDVALSSCPPEQLPSIANLEADNEKSRWTMGISIPPGGADVRVTKRFEQQGVRNHVVYGRVYYHDIFGRQHSSGFIQRVLTTARLLRIKPLPNTQLGISATRARAKARRPQ
jgi:hypothetical protein